MQAKILVVVFVLLACSVTLAERAEAPRVVIKTQMATESSSKSVTLIIRLWPGREELFGDRFPKLRILVLPVEADQVPLQISLVAESGQTLSSTIVYYTPEYGAEFSLDAEGIDAHGSISSTSKANSE